MSNQNNLKLIDLSAYEELKVTELENAMIALNIIFQKVVKLPKSRWPGMKDKTINIPVFESDVLNTLKSLPRTPSNAGIIPINFKRKVAYKNSHMVQYISISKIMKALKTLKALGNKYYQFVPFSTDFEDECREIDLAGFKFIFPEDEICNDNDINMETEPTEKNVTFPNSAQNRTMSIEIEQEKEGVDSDSYDTADCYNDLEDELERDEEEYQTLDPVKKWQFPYNKSTCFSHNYPEISYDDQRERVSVAPGEGKCPSNILEEKDWDLK